MAREIVMPSLGMFTGEGTVTRWLRPSGARVGAEEPVVEITTEKTTQEVVAPGAGILHHVAPEGANLPIQGLIGYVLADGEPLPSSPPPAPGRMEPAAFPPPGLETRGRGDPGAAPTPIPTSGGSASSRPSVSTSTAGSGEGPRASPIARRLATENGIDLMALVGSGPGGRIVEADVLAAIERKKGTAPGTLPPAAPPLRRVRERVPLIGIRRTIAERLHASQAAIAAVTLTREVDAETLVAARLRLSDRLGPIPYDALFAKILAAALQERPTFNAVIEEGAILVLEEINVGFAVAVPAGLVVPVVRAADRRPLAEVSTTIRELTQRARANRLTFEDLSGGTVTITNLGAHGVDAFTPIINPPQAAILGIGRIAARAVVRDGQLAVGTTTTLSLTFDHRVADGVPAAQLLDDVARLMNDASYLDGLD